jgi:allantoin racemase
VRILFINPNTSAAFTERIGQIARQYAAAGTEVLVRAPDAGPRSIESAYDEVLSAPGTLEVALRELDQVDGLVLACYSDHPVIYALREATSKPVLGIAEASMYMACMLGQRFSVVTTNQEWEPRLWEAVRRYGLAERCASVRSTGLPVLALESASPKKTHALVLNEARKALEEDGAEVICLGCAGMAGMDKDMQAELGVPVLDGVVCALKLLEGMLEYGLETSKRLTYRTPGSKELVDLPRIYARVYKKK